MLPIAIPSRSRAHRVGTLIKQIPEALRHTIRVFSPVSQYDAYTRNLSMYPQIEVIALPDAHRMAEVRKFIGNWHDGIGCNIFLMMDDDVRLEQRVNAIEKRTKTCDHADVTRMISFLEERLLDGRWGQVGIRPRMFQNAMPGGPPDELVLENTRNTCVTGWRTEDFRRVDYTRCVVRSDFDATIQLLRQGRPNLISCYWMHNQTNHTEGGCADYRTTEIANAAAHHLASLHPGLVRVVEKSYRAQERRTSHNMGTRLEVVVNWKEAFGYDLRLDTEQSA